MAGSTSKGFPYPSLGDSPNVPADIQALATALNTLVPTLDSAETLNNKTLNKPNEDYPRLWSPREYCTATAVAATGTINFSYYSQAVLYYTTNASGNFVLNFRGSSGQTLNSALASGESAGFVFINTNGATPYYLTSITIDGSAQTVKWAGGVAPSAGNANSLDAYTFTIIKTSSTPSYTVLGSFTKFA